MKFLNLWRERRIARIEHRVAELTREIDRAWLVVLQRGLDPNTSGEAVGAVVLEGERKRLWFKRSAILKKLPPTYQGDPTP